MERDLLIGCCGFPESMGSYATEFVVAEVQQTFYQPPMQRTLEKWRNQVPEGFEFTLKAWQLITHETSSPTYRRLRDRLNGRQKREAGGFRLNSTVMAAWQRTLECARILRSRLILFQCPARFAPSAENKSNLRAFFGKVRRETGTSRNGVHLTFVWEPRGEWKREEVRELCEELGLIHGVDPFVQQTTTKRPGYFRLHGRGGYRYRYSEHDFQQLFTAARQQNPCYVLFNNIAMLDDARRLLRLAAARRRVVR